MRVARHGGYSLLEVLAALAIIAVLAALLLPAVQYAREASRRVGCAANLRQLGVALNNYHSAHGTFPIANLPLRYWSWQSAVLPFMDGAALYDKIQFETAQHCATYLSNNPEVAGTRVPSFQCPSDPLAGAIYNEIDADFVGKHMCMSYLGVSGSKVRIPVSCNTLDTSRDGMLFSHYVSAVRPECNRFYPAVPTRVADAVDGAAKTLLVGERGVPEDPSIGTFWGWLLCGTGINGSGEGDHVLSVGYGFQANQTVTDARTPPPQNSRTNIVHFWSHHPGGGHFLFVDGHVSFQSYDVDFRLLQAMATRAGNDTGG